MTDASIVHGQLKPRVKPLKAARALVRFLRDKEATDEVFRFTRYVDAPVVARRAERFAASEFGARVMGEARSLAATLSDRAALAAMPDASLGRAYLDFVTREGLSPEGFQAELDAGGGLYDQAGSAIGFYSQRVSHMHDLFHVVTGYGRDFIGELALLAFTQRQTGNRAFGVLRFFGAFKAMREYPGLPVWAAMREGSRLGRRAEQLVYADWEALLVRPLADVRRELGVRPPRRYLGVKAGAELIDARNRELLRAA